MDGADERRGDIFLVKALDDDVKLGAGGIHALEHITGIACLLAETVAVGLSVKFLLEHAHHHIVAMRRPLDGVGHNGGVHAHHHHGVAIDDLGIALALGGDARFGLGIDARGTTFNSLVIGHFIILFVAVTTREHEQQQGYQ